MFSIYFVSVGVSVFKHVNQTILGLVLTVNNYTTKNHGLRY